MTKASTSSVGTKHPAGLADAKHSAMAAALIGVGLMAAIDEIVFHQLLAWHHFYDGSTPLVGLISDGFLHAAELVALVSGATWLGSLLRRGVCTTNWAWAGLFLGLGGFQLFDGIVNHKLIRLHQIRYGVPLLPYDIAWNMAGASLLLVGAILAHRALRQEPDRAATQRGHDDA